MTSPTPLTMTVKERRSREARWKRRYPSLAHWLHAHPGEPAGKLISAPSEVFYYAYPHNGGWRQNWTGEVYQIPPCAILLAPSEFL